MTPPSVPSVDRNELEPRQEHRFLVNEEVVRLAMRTAATHLDIARDDRPYQWSTTTYCDTYDWSVFRAAVRGRALRLRFREYDRSRPPAILHGDEVWIELKDDQNGTSSKERYAVPPREVPAFLRGEAALPAGANGMAERAGELLRAGARPAVVTQYNRIAYAGPRDRIRITADHNLMYLGVPWDSHDASVPLQLGPVLARESDVIVEMKWVGELPGWGEELLAWLHERAGTERPSKFVVGMRHLLGETST